MKQTSILRGWIGVTLGVVVMNIVPGSVVYAHCDTLGGPVVVEARAALEKGDVTPVLKWVKKDHEQEIRLIFKKTMAIRGKGREEKELADQYFLETLVRLHRAGEGAPYTGIKNEPVEPIVAMADKALVDGSADEMIGRITSHFAAVIKEKFNRVVETGRNKDKSLEAGREFVEAYVAYMHYVEGVHSAIVATGGHHHAEAGEASGEHDEHKE